MLDLRNFKPCFLLAMPQLLDPNFHHTVVLLAEYNAEGAFGLVVNRPIDRTLGQVERPESPVDKRLHDQSIWYGGPIELDNAMVIFEDKSAELVNVLGPNVSALGNDLYITGNTLILTTHAEALSKLRFKVVAGHAGWGMTQLDTEIAQSAWLAAPLNKDMIFSEFETMWTRTVKSLGIDPNQLATAMPVEGESELAN